METDELEVYRRMTPAERIQLALELAEFGWRNLDVPDRETGDRKWAAWLTEHDKSRDALVAGLIRELKRSSEIP